MCSEQCTMECGAICSYESREKYRRRNEIFIFIQPTAGMDINYALSTETLQTIKITMKILYILKENGTILLYKLNKNRGKRNLCHEG